MATLQEMMAQKAQLETAIHELQTKERGEAMTKIKQLMSDYGLTIMDFRTTMGGPRSMNPRGVGSRSSGPVAAKYRNTETGETWSGRGLQPKWLKAAIAQGKKIEDFSLDKPATPVENVATAAAAKTAHNKGESPFPAAKKVEVPVPAPAAKTAANETSTKVVETTKK